MTLFKAVMVFAKSGWGGRVAFVEAAMVFAKSGLGGRVPFVEASIWDFALASWKASRLFSSFELASWSFVSAIVTSCRWMVA